MWQTLYPGQGRFACAGTQENRTYCWGDNDQEPVQNAGSSFYSTPQEIQYPNPDGSDLLLSDIQSGMYHSCGIHQPSTYFYCWGNNDFGQLGTGDVSSTYISEPTLGAPMPLFDRFFVGDQSLCMLWDDDYPGISIEEGDFRCFFPQYNGDDEIISAAGSTVFTGMLSVQNFIPGDPSIGLKTNGGIFLFNKLRFRNRSDYTNAIIEQTLDPLPTLIWDTP